MSGFILFNLEIFFTKKYIYLLIFHIYQIHYPTKFFFSVRQDGECHHYNLSTIFHKKNLILDIPNSSNKHLWPNTISICFKTSKIIS